MSHRHIPTARLAARVIWICLLVSGPGLDGAAFGARGGVHSFEKIRLGGLEQTILIRGDSTDLPILLFLHGGPGISEIPVAHAERELEHDFLVVQWDQRGTGKSYAPDIPASAMRLENFVQDTEALSRYLLSRFGKQKLYLAGYSFGSLVGALSAERSPELYHAYIGLSQLVNVPASDRLLYQQTLNRARERGDGKSFASLTSLGPPPYHDPVAKKRANSLAHKLAGAVPHRFTGAHYASLALFSPYYSFADDARMLKGMAFSSESLTRQIHEADLFKEAPRLDVPVYFFEGRNDTVLSPILVEKYYRALAAPRGKHLVWFEKSAHGIQIEERAKYHAELRKVLRETGGGSIPSRSRELSRTS